MKRPIDTARPSDENSQSDAACAPTGRSRRADGQSGNDGLVTRSQRRHPSRQHGTPDTSSSESDGDASTTEAVPTPRIDTPPVDQRDYEDRHDTRATSNDRVLRRYIRLGWHRTFQRLVSIVVITVLYVGAVIALPHLVPNLTIKQAIAIVTAASLMAAGGGYGLFTAGQAVQRYRRRRAAQDAGTS